jgi:hypothetical protein
MSLRHSFRKWFSSHRTTIQSSRKRKHADTLFRARLKLELLEDRLAPSGGLTVGPNLDITKTAANEAETTISVNPKNTNQLFEIDTLTDQGRFSTDGGVTWNLSNMAGFTSTIGDTQTAWDRFGNLYLTQFGAGLDIEVGISTDGGATFASVRTITGSGGSDQPSIAVGPGSAGNLGSVWVSYEQGGVIKASGAGVNGLGAVGAFSAAQTAPGSTNGDFGNISIGPAGQVLVTYQDGLDGSVPAGQEGPGTIFTNLDPDGLGAGGFNAAITAHGTNVGGTASVPPQPGPFNVGGRTIDSEANAVYDTSGGVHNGRVYMVYTDRTSVPPPANNNTDIFVIFSDNNGTNWSSPVRVNDDPSAGTVGATQYLPAIAVDQTTGLVGVSWYDTRNSGTGTTRDTYASASMDGGATFLPNVRLSAALSNPLSPAVGTFNSGDFDQMSFANAVFYRSWSDNSNSTGNNPAGSGNAFDVYTDRTTMVADLASIDSSGNLVITDLTGVNNDITLKLVPGGFLQIHDNNAFVIPFSAGMVQVDTNTVNVPLASITGGVIVNTLAGSDTLTVDNSGGLITRAIKYHGGSGFDTLNIQGDPGAAQAVSHDTYAVGATPDAGVVTLVSTVAGLTESIAFDGLAPINDVTPAALYDIVLSNGADTATLQNGPIFAGFQTDQVFPNSGTFETTNFANKTTARVDGNNGADNLRLDYSIPAAGLATVELYGNGVAGVMGVSPDDNATDVLRVWQTPAGVTNNLFGQGGNDDFTNFADPHGFDMTLIQGPVFVDGGPGTNDFAFSDASSATAVTTTLTNTGQYQLTSTGWANITYTNLANFYFESSSANDTNNVLFTAAGTSYIVNGDGGSDTFTVGNTAANFNANNFNGTLANILGPVTVYADYNGVQGAADTFNVDASGDAALAGIASITNVGNVSHPLRNSTGETLTAPTTRLANFAGVFIDYAHGDITSNLGGVNPNRLEHLNVRASAGNDTINVQDTTATISTTIQGVAGNDTFNITGSNLSGANDFQGDDNGGLSSPGNDTFNLNLSAGTSIGSNAVYTVTGVNIEGDAPGGNSANRDRLNINDSSAIARNLNFHYQSTTAGNLNIEANASGKGLFGAAGGGFLPLVVTTMETVVFNSPTNINTVQATGVAGSDDRLTVALVPTLAASATLPVGTRADGSALVFLGGSPYTNAPPATIANSRPGVAGGSFGPDLLINGITAGAGITLDGGGNSGTAGAGDQAFVYAASENALVDTGNATNIFGFGAGVLQPGFGAGNAYDNINVSDTLVTTNNNANGSLTPVHLNTASFVQAGPAFASQQPGLTVNGGDEAAPLGDVADNITASISHNFNIQVNGNLPNLTTGAFGQPQGDQLNLIVTGSINVFSDNSNPPIVTISGLPSVSVFGVKESSIERLFLRPTNGIVNILGDNNDPNATQNDVFVVRGQDVNFNPLLPVNGQNSFSLQIGGDKVVPSGPVHLSSPIYFSGVTRINAFGGNAIGFDAQGNAIGEVNNTGVDTLDITPYADNTPRGWGIETYFNEGDPVNDGDQVVFNGVPGVSESIVVQPSASQAGQVYSTNAATGTPIAVLNYMLNTNIIVNGSSPAGTLGDTDTLTLRGTDPASSGTSGNDTFDIDLTRAGTPGNEWIQVTDSANAAPIYNVQNFTNFNTVNVQMLGGADTAFVVGSNDGSVNFNIDGGNDGLTNLVDFLGTANAADTFTVQQGSSSNSAAVTAQRSTATAPTTVNLTNINLIDLNGGGGTASDSLSVFGTSASNSFTLESGAGAGISGLIGVDNFPNVFYFDMGSGGGGTFSTVALNGGRFGGGGGQGNDTLGITGTTLADTYTYTPVSSTDGQLREANAIGTIDYSFTNFISARLDASAPSTVPGDTLNVAATNAIITPGATSGSGQVTATDAGGQGLLPLTYVNVENAVVTGGTVVVNGTEQDDTFTVSGTGIVTVRNAGGVVVQSYDLTGAAQIVLNGLSGDDTFNISGTFAGTIQVIGGSNGNGSDTLNVSGTNVSVDLGASTVSGVIGGTISFTGVEHLGVTATGNITVIGTGGADALSVTPTGANTATIVPSSGGLLDITTNNPGTLTIDPGAGNDTVTVNGTSVNDTITVLPSGTNTTVQVNALQAITLVNADTEALVVAGGLGNDTLSVNATGNTVPVAIPITYDGGPGTNALILRGTATSDTYTPGSQLGSGTNTIVYAGGTEHVQFLNLAPIFDFVAGPLVVNGTNADNAINYREGFNSLANFMAGVQSPTWGEVSVDGYEPMEFINKTTLTINALAGSDTTNLNNPNTPTGLTGITVNGGDPTAGSDTLIVNGTSGNDTIGYNPSDTIGSGTVTVNALPTITFTTIEAVAIDGQGGTDALTLTTASGVHRVTFTPGATADAGTITTRIAGGGATLVPLSFSHLGAGGSVTFASAGGREDVLALYGTNNSDVFNVNGPGDTIQILTPTGGFVTTVLHTGGISTLELSGLNGDDQFNLTGGLPYVNGTVVDGGDPSASDIVTMNGATSAVTVNLGDSTIPTTTTVTGYGGRVTLIGVEVANLNPGANALTITGTAGPDSLTYTPTGTSAGTVTAAGLNTVFNFSNATGTFTIDPGDGNDTVTVNGTSASDTIVATGGATSATVQVNALKTVTLPVASTESLVVSAGNGNDSLTVDSTTAPFLIPIVYDGGVGTDSLMLTGGTASTDTYTPGPTPGSGTSSIVFTSGGGGTQTVNFINLEPVLDNVTATTAIVNGTDADNAINYTQGPGSSEGGFFTGNTGLVTIDSQESYEFNNKTNLVINALAGSDTINLNNSVRPAGLTSITVTGGDPTAGSDTLIVNGVAGATDDLVVNPTGTGSGDVREGDQASAAATAAFVPVTFTTIEHLAIVGQTADGDGLRAGGTTGDDTVEVAPGATPDAGTITGFTTNGGAVGTPFSFVPIQFSGITGFVVAASAFVQTGGSDTVIVDGSNANDTFNYNATGPTAFISPDVTVTTGPTTTHTPIALGASVANLDLRGLEGNDTFNVNLNPLDGQTSVAILVEGNGPSTGTLNYTAPDGAATTINYGTSTITSTGPAANPVTFAAISTINETSSGAGSTLTVVGAGNDNISYTPTGGNAGTVTQVGSTPVINFTGVGSTFTIDPGAGTNTVTVNGTSSNDSITAVVSATIPTNTVVRVNVLKAVNIVTADTQALAVNGLLGNDELVVNSGNGPITIPITYDGGPGTNSLRLTNGGTATAATSDVYTPGSQLGSGTSTITFAAGTELVHFLNLAPIFDLVPGPLVVNGTNAANAINYREGFNSLANFMAGVQSPTWGEVSVDSYEPMEFINKTTLAINALAGSDTINLNNSHRPTGLTSITVTGGDPTAGSDTLIVNGVAGAADDLVVNPTGTGSGDVREGDQASAAATAAFVPVTFTTIEHLAIVGQTTDGDGLRAGGTTGNDTEEVAPGATPDAGTITGSTTNGGAGGTAFSFVPIQFSGITSFIVPDSTFVQTGGADTVIVDGTSADDTFTYNATGPSAFVSPDVTVSTGPNNTHTPITPGFSVTSIDLRGLDGNDTFNLNFNPLAGQTTIALRVEGGDSDQFTDTLNYTAPAGAATTINLGASTITSTGPVANPVTYSGIEAVNANASGGTLTVLGTSGADTIAATPTSGTGVTFQAYTGGTAQNGQGGTLASLTPLAPVFNATNVSTAAGGFTINGNGGADQLFVEGTQNADTIDVNDATSGANAVTVAGLLTVNYNAALPHVEVDSLAGSDTINLAPSATTTFLVDGGDPIGVLPGDTLNLIHPAGAPFTHFPGPTSDSGGLSTAGFQTVSWIHIETVINSGGGGPPVIVGTNGNDEITVIARDSSYNPALPGVPNPLLDGVQDFTVSVNGGPDMLFINQPFLFIDALSGNDDIVVREPAPNQAVWNVQVYVAAGPPASGSSGLGDNIELETPGTQRVTYNPNNPLSAIPPVTGVVFTTPSAGGGQFNDAGNTSTITATQFLIPLFYQSSPGGAEQFVYAGEAGNDTLTYNSPANANAGSNLVYTPGATADAGTITGTQVGGAALTPLSFSNLGTTGHVSFTTSNTGRTDALNVEGVPAVTGQSFSVVPANGGTVQLTQLQNGNTNLVTVPIFTPAVKTLELDGLGGSDTFNITGSTDAAGALLYTSLVINDGTTVNLNGAAGPVTVHIGDNTPNSPNPNTVITGYGAPVTLIDVDTANLDANGQTFTATGTTQNDNIIYTPTGATAGTFYDNIGSGNNLVPNTVFNMTNVAGNFMVFNDPGGNADQVTIRGTAARDLFEISQGTGIAQVLANNVTALLPVELGISAEILNAVGLGGQNTFQVIPGPGIAGQAQDNLLINLDGGTTGAFNALVVASSFGATPAPLAANQFVVVNKNPEVNSGTVRVFTAAVADPDINYRNIQIVSPNVSGTSLNPNLLVMGPDLNEPNDQQGNSTFLGSGATLQVQHATIFPGSTEFIGVPADNDYYRVVAQATGTLDYQVYFRTFNPALLPAGGQINLQGLDANGNVIASAPGTFGAAPGTGNARIRIPVVAGQSYFLHVFGATAGVVNGYDMTVINTAPPTPFNLELSRSVPNGEPGIPAGIPGTGDLPPNAPANDTGRSQFDNVTRINTPRIYLRLSDGVLLNDLPGNGTPNNPPAGVIPIPFSPNATTAGYRVALFDGNDSQNPIAFATPVGAGFPGLYQIDITTALTDGVHHLTAAVQMVDPATPTETGFGPVSTSLDITVDTVPPPVFFGLPGNPTDGLAPQSDTGVGSDPPTLADRITSSTVPTFFGTAEANSVVRLFLDSNGNGVFDAGDLLVGLTTATPADGTNAFPNGQWTIRSTVNLNDPALTPILGFDGKRRFFVTAEDLAGNVSPQQQLDIFLDTQGPQITNVFITGSPNFNLFGLKPSQIVGPSVGGPTPLVNGLTINLQDLPAEDAEFLRNAIDAGLAASPGDYLVVGDNTGPVAITQVIVINNPPVVGQPATASIQLVFAKPLPDDRFTLTVIADSVRDVAGNELDGESNAIEPNGAPNFPTGDLIPGGNFVARFTVNSRPHIGTYFGGNQFIDLNGNGVFDPTNVNNDATNADRGFSFDPIVSDALFAGNFAATGTPANGFSKFGAYGSFNGVYRWMLDLQGLGFATYSVVSGLQINGLPVAGHFNPALSGDQIALFDGQGNWYIDFTGTNNLGPTSLVIHDNLTGFPMVGDFDGNGSIDLATYRPDLKTFFFDLNPLTGARTFPTMEFGFAGITARPVAADFNRDGVTDIGLFVPGQQGTGTSDKPIWNILISTGQPVPGTINTLNHPFDPTPLGNDLFFSFGNNQDLPLVGLFDPPITPAPAPSVTVTQLRGFYQDTLGRPISGGETLSWLQQSAAGLSTPQLAATLVNSSEAQANVLMQDYQRYLGRPADAAALQSWLPALTGGASEQGLVTGLLSSQEYYQRQGGTTETFVSALYRDLLHRQASFAEVAQWLGLAAISRDAVVQAIQNSPESLGGVVMRLYQDYLGRPASAAEVAPWIAALQSGSLTPQQISVALLTSGEYQQRSQSQPRAGHAPAAPVLPTGTVGQVSKLFNDLLNRQPGTAELASWSQMITSRSLSKVDVASLILHSAEAQANVIGRDYQRYLGRPADAAAAQSWLPALVTGGSEQQVLVGILSSQEYYQDQGSTVDGFIRALYRDLLHRQAQTTEVAQWRRQAAASRASVVQQFLSSSEYLGGAVAQLYLDHLARPASAAEVAPWVTALQAGSLTIEQVAVGLLSTDEYLRGT